MSNVSTSRYYPTPEETRSADVEQHVPAHIQEQKSHANPYPELPQDWKSGLSIQDRIKDRETDFTEDDKTKAWKGENEAVKTYRDEMVQRWIVQMDTLLVYAGLFSTVLTAFNVESYLLLSPTAPDPVLAALTQMSAQLASFSVHDPFVNSTRPAFQPSLISSDSTSPQRWAIWLNALWFSSLICSLSAASIVIMVKQWLHEYNNRISGSTPHTTRLRQHRYNGLVKWKVAAIIEVLPVLLQIAFGLFLAGLLILLWNLNRTVAIVASTLVGALLAFTLVTTILPTFTSNCAYLSPLSLSVFRVSRLIYTLIQMPIYTTAKAVGDRLPSGSILESISDSLRNFFQKPLHPSVYAMQLAYVARNRLRLDQDGFVAAYFTTGDLALMDHASVCLSDDTMDALSEFLTRIHVQNMEYGQLPASTNHWTQSIPLDMASDMLLFEAHQAAQNTKSDMSTWHAMTHGYLSSSHAVLNDQPRTSYALSNLAAVLYHNGKIPDSSFMRTRSRCLLSLRQQMTSAKENSIVLKNTVRKRVIAAIHTVLRTRKEASWQPGNSLEWVDSVVCLHILTLCVSSSTPRSPPERGDMPPTEEDTNWKPLADAMVMAEEEVVTTFQSPLFREEDSQNKCYVLKKFFEDYQDIGLEQLAKRVSEKMLHALKETVNGLSSSAADSVETCKHGWLEWLNKLEEERRKKHIDAGH